MITVTNGFAQQQDYASISAENDRLRAELDRTTEAYTSLREEHDLFRAGTAESMDAMLRQVALDARRRYGALADDLDVPLGKIILVLEDLEECRELADRRRTKYAGSSVTHADILAAKLLRTMEKNQAK